MDPIAVLRLLWRHRYALLPVILVTLGAAIYVFQFAPRAYESSMSIAIVNPNVPTEVDKQVDRRLADLNSDNPYLRSSDASLISQVVIARLNAPSTARELEAAGLSSEYRVGPGSAGNGFIVDITGIGLTAEHSLATTQALGAQLEEDLRQVQKVNGADDRYLFTPIVVTEPIEAIEQFSSRLRLLIVVFLGGGVLAFAAISLARGVETTRQRRQQTGARATGVGVAGASESDKRSPTDAGASSSQSIVKGEEYEDPDPRVRPSDLQASGMQAERDQ